MFGYQRKDRKENSFQTKKIGEKMVPLSTPRIIFLQFFCIYYKNLGGNYLRSKMYYDNIHVLSKCRKRNDENCNFPKKRAKN
ncbi:heavy metal-associated isoprenylated plant protein 39-like isoform X2 [Iris pallida]|uniref:Heavy metal-associated isoprenylated plant protein 39-like isoform X2 n=1 Tax=Iris pallida TaxID=29817 RepID=A0AAX6H3N8_IRIPA|nr:heavy metal-associated isoprenylated plant protein 39-like isoform X2 [Iris pallida]